MFIFVSSHECWCMLMFILYNCITMWVCTCQFVSAQDMFGIPRGGRSFCQCFFFQDMVSWTLPLRRRLIKPFKQPTICSLDPACWQCGWPIVAKAPGILTHFACKFFGVFRSLWITCVYKIYEALLKEAQILNLLVTCGSRRIPNIRTEDYSS